MGHKRRRAARWGQWGSPRQGLSSRLPAGKTGVGRGWWGRVRESEFRVDDHVATTLRAHRVRGLCPLVWPLRGPSGRAPRGCGWQPAPCCPDRLDRDHLILTSGATPPGGRRVRHFAPPKGGFRGCGQRLNLASAGLSRDWTGSMSAGARIRALARSQVSGSCRADGQRRGETVR